MEEGYQSSSERHGKTPKRGLNETCLTDPLIYPTGTSTKMDHFELSDDLGNDTWEINSDLAGYANKQIKTFLSKHTLIEDILRASPTLQCQRGLSPRCMFERISEQRKRLPLNQGKSLINLQKRSFFIYEPLSKIWTI